jgi:hypothetical protein
VRSAIRNPLAWAFVATALSVVALVVAVGAYGRAGTTREVAAPQSTTVGAATAAPTTAETPTLTAEPTAIGDEEPGVGATDDLVTALPSPGASYSVSRQDVQMRLVSGSNRFVDLDQPLVNAAESAYDVEYDDGLSQPVLTFRSADVAVGKSANVTPDECAQEIQLSPVDTKVEVSQDLVLCAVTNGLGAVNEPARTKMARIIVNSVSKDNSVNLTVTTWEIPR